MTLRHFSEYIVVNTAAPKDTTNPDTGDVDPAMMVFLLVVSATALVILSNKKRLAK